MAILLTVPLSDGRRADSAARSSPLASPVPSFLGHSDRTGAPEDPIRTRDRARARFPFFVALPCRFLPPRLRRYRFTLRSTVSRPPSAASTPCKRHKKCGDFFILHFSNFLLSFFFLLFFNFFVMFFFIFVRSRGRTENRNERGDR